MKGRKMRDSGVAAGKVFHAEARCARDEVVGLPERSEPEGPQGAARGRGAERKMRDSGVDWIGKIPEGWEVGRVKHYFYHTKEIARGRASAFDRLALTLQGVIKRGKEDTNGLQPKEFEGYQILRKNELVFKLIDLQNISTSRVGRSPFDGIVSPAYIILHSRHNVDTAFRYYYFLSMWMHDIFQTLGGDAVRSCLNSDDLLNVPLLTPPLAEQKAIAAYLDEKCGAIDAAVTEAKKGIEEYKVWKKSLIFEAVTGKRRVGAFNAETQRGGGAEKIKPSGIPWIGDIPEGWEVISIKEILRNVTIKDHPDARVLSLYRELGILPKDSRDDNHNVTSEDTAQYKFVRIGNVVINKMKAWQGSIGVSAYEGIVSPAYYVCEFLDNNQSPVFIHFLLRNKKLAQEFERLSTGMRVGQWDLGIDDFLRVKIPFPPLAEQKAIADYLDEKCAAIDALVAEKEALIADLEAYKKSLIYETVTGKREVA